MLESLRIAQIAFISKLVLILGGPLTIIFLSLFLSEEELGFYYVFISIVAMRQLMELGISNVLKQFYSHKPNKRNDYFSFSKVWYVLIGIAFSFISLLTSVITFDNYSGTIFWECPLYSLVISTTLVIYKQVYVALFDGMQKQILLHKMELVFSLCYIVLLWGGIYTGLGLYSIAIANLVPALLYIIASELMLRKKVITIETKALTVKVFKEILNELWPLLSKVVVVSVFGYIYWNSFNLIAFRVLSAEVAGSLGLSISMARAGLNLSNSLVNSQVTKVSRLISEGKTKLSRKLYFTWGGISAVLCLLGYLTFLCAYHMFPEFVFFRKVLPINDIVYLLVYFFVVLLISMVNGYVRCFKLEPFIKQTTFNAVLTPVLFLLSINYGLSYFSLSIVLQIMILIHSIIYMVRFLRRICVQKNLQQVG